MERHDYSEEPMDIDLSSQSVKDMDISFAETDYYMTNTYMPDSSHQPSQQTPSIDHLPPPTIKKYHINIQKPKRSSRHTLIKITVAVVFLFISIITYHMLCLKCCDQINLEILKDTLSEKIYGQSSAVDLLIGSLKIKTRSKLLLFSGGTGVGKTLTSTLLLETIGACSNVYHYTMPTFKTTFSTDLMFGLTMCESSFIIVDDLTTSDLDINVQVQEVIDKSEALGKDITVLLIYNCIEDLNGYRKGCDTSFSDKLLENYSHIKALKRLIFFEPLHQKHLRECITQELGTRTLSNYELDAVLKHFNVSIDGCKGVHSKMKYFNIV